MTRCPVRGFTLQFEAALRIDPDNPATHLNFGLSLEAVGRIDEAIDHFRAAVQVDPSHPAASHLERLTGS